MAKSPFFRVTPSVIIAFAESLSAPEVTWSLADQGFQVIALTRRGRRSALRHSRFARVVEISPPGPDFSATAAELKFLCQRASSDGNLVGLMPLDDEAVWLCANAERCKGVTLIGPSGDQARLALDKNKQIALARASGFLVPRTTYLEKPEDLQPQAIEYPIVLKAAQAVTVTDRKLSRGASWTCSDSKELEAAIVKWAGRCPMLLQQFIPGVGEGLFGIATPTGIVAWSGHRRVRMMNPHGSGSSACQAVWPLDDATKSAAQAFIQSSGWRGIFMIELLRDASGQAWFIELNGRAWGSMALARRSGLEYPAWAAKMALEGNTTFEVPQRKDARLVCRHLGRELLHFLFVARGPKSKALHGWPSTWRTFFELSRLSADQRWYNWRRDDPKVLLVDTYRTVRDQLLKPRQIQ